MPLPETVMKVSLDDGMLKRFVDTTPVDKTSWSSLQTPAGSARSLICRHLSGAVLSARLSCLSVLESMHSEQYIDRTGVRRCVSHELYSLM